MGVDGRDFVTLAGIHTNGSLPLCKNSKASPSHGEATRKIRHYSTRQAVADYGCLLTMLADDNRTTMKKLAPFLDQALLMRFAISLDAFLAMQLQFSTHVYGSLAQRLVLAALYGSTERRTRQKSGGP